MSAMGKPTRVQRKRTKGWTMPANTVYVGRPTKWGNPYAIGGWVRPSFAKLPVQIQDAAHAVAFFAMDALDPKAGAVFRDNARRELSGKNLACWCPLVDKDGKPVPCHADVLLEIANS